MSTELVLDLTPMSWVDAWGQIAGSAMQQRVQDALAQQLADPYCPLLPDLAATAPLIASWVTAQKPDAVRFVCRHDCPPEITQTLTWVQRSITPPCTTKLETQAGAADSALLLAEGRATELAAIAGPDRLRAALAVGDHSTVIAASETAETAFDLRMQLLATRAAGRLDLLPALRARLAEMPKADTALGRGWTLFDHAVACADDPVRLGYLDYLNRADTHAAGLSGQLDAAIAIWSATYQFHAANMPAADAAQMRGLAALRQLGARNRAMFVALRNAHLQWITRDRAAARQALLAAGKEAFRLGHNRIADNAALTAYFWGLRLRLPLESPTFISDQRDGLCQIAQSVTERAWHKHCASSPVIMAQATMVRLARGHGDRETTARLSQAAAQLGPEDATTLRHDIARSMSNQTASGAIAV